MVTNKSKVLVIDDFEMVRYIEKKTLTELGYSKIEDASDGMQAIQKLEEAHAICDPFDLILCDWNMPKMSGLDLLIRVKRIVHLRDIPFFIVTAESDKVAVIKAIEAGASDFIIKPFSKDTFLNKIQKFNLRMAKAA